MNRVAGHGVGRAAGSTRGFSLLELLVAFAIMAMSLGLIYRSLGSSATQSGQLATQEQAALLAQSLLSLRESVTSQGWNESGESPPFSWRVSSQPYPTGVSGTNLVPLHQIDLVISWSDGTRSRQLQLQTLLPQRNPLPGETL